jgi:hypothetical protein
VHRRLLMLTSASVLDTSSPFRRRAVGFDDGPEFEVVTDAGTWIQHRFKHRFAAELAADLCQVRPDLTTHAVNDVALVTSAGREEHHPTVRQIAFQLW